MSDKKPPSEFDQHRANVNLIIAELEEQLSGWTPKKKEDK